MRLAAPLAAAGLAEIEVAAVDHRLRPESRRESDFVVAQARSVGLSAAILDWDGGKPLSGLQAAARRARYSLLIGRALTIGADAVMTAHTADDQAETVLMRLARGAGPRGLGGMAEDSCIAAGPSPSVRLLRPLLDARRGALRDFLRGQGAAWMEDPSNENALFERVRVRQFLARAEDRGDLRVEALVETAAACRVAAARLEAVENARFAALGGTFDAVGGASIVAAGLEASDAPLIGRLAHAVGGGAHPPGESASAATLSAALAAGAATLGGAIIRAEDGRIFFAREPAAALGRGGAAGIPAATIEPGRRVLWDDRFIVRNLLDETADLRPLGEHARFFALEGERAESRIAAPGLWVRGVLAAAAGDSDGFEPLAAERFFRRVNRFP